MKIVVDINHPAHVHLFKNLIWNMCKDGHEILITASEKDVAFKLLDNYGLNYIAMGSYGHSILNKLANIPLMDLKMYQAIKNFHPDMIVGLGSIRAAHVSKLIKRPSIIFDDDEYSYPYYSPFCDVICGFSGFKKQGKKIIKIDSYKELAYLHPNYFKPRKSLIKNAGISGNEEFILLRFVGWQAFHDINKSGFSLEEKRKLVKELSEYCTVFISSESRLPQDLEKYKLPISPENIHDFIYYAKLIICDSQTMTTEAGVLGTPAIRCNSFVGINDMGNFIELEHKYSLIYNYSDSNKVMAKAIDLVKLKDLKHEWAFKRDHLLNSKANLTLFMLWFIENYPDSLQEFKKNPEMQYLL